MSDECSPIAKWVRRSKNSVISFWDNCKRYLHINRNSPTTNASCDTSNLEQKRTHCVAFNSPRPIKKVVVGEFSEKHASIDRTFRIKRKQTVVVTAREHK